MVNSLPPTSLDTDTINTNTFLRAELNIALENTKNLSKTRDIICKLFDVKNFSNSSLIILLSVGGRGTDPNFTYKFLQYGSWLFLKDTENSDRVFVSGDQKIMSLTMHLKKQYDNFDHYYVAIPDLHFRKSVMHTIVRQYEHLGIKHLAKFCGYDTDNQWDYIKIFCSIHKSLEFLEKLCDSFHLALSYEFYAYLLESKQVDAKTIFELNNDALIKILPLLKDFIEKCCVHDQVFQKNTDLFNIIETIVSHYTAERSRNWDLCTAALKELIHFAMISNYTQYGPPLVELLFHQSSFQEQYLDLMREGFFTHKF